jgi:Flp pilus assembly protein TadD
LGALDAATTLAPDNGEGWLLKATLLRRMDRLGEAQTAIERAAALTPGGSGNGPQIGLEAGVIAVLAGREAAARQSWRSVIELAPESLAAVTAKDYLAQLGDAQDTAAPTPDEAEEPPP